MTAAREPTVAAASNGEARLRILKTAYDLFSRYNARSVSMDTVIAQAGVAKTTMYRHFPTKEDLVLAFLDERERRWTVEWLMAGVSQSATTPDEKLLRVFELYDAWINSPDYEACSFAKTVLESTPGSAVHAAAAKKLDAICEFLASLARDARLSDPDAFARTWHMLLQGALLSAYSGNRNAAQDAKLAGKTLLENWPREASTRR